MCIIIFLMMKNLTKKNIKFADEARFYGRNFAFYLAPSVSTCPSMPYDEKSNLCINTRFIKMLWEKCVITYFVNNLISNISVTDAMITKFARIWLSHIKKFQIDNSDNESFYQLDIIQLYDFARTVSDIVDFFFKQSLFLNSV